MQVYRTARGGCLPYFGFYGNDIAGVTDVPLQQWVHLAFRYEALKGEMCIFIDGKQDASSDGHQPFQGTRPPCLLSRGSRLPPSWFGLARVASSSPLLLPPLLCSCSALVVSLLCPSSPLLAFLSLGSVRLPGPYIQ